MMTVVRKNTRINYFVCHFVLLGILLELDPPTINIMENSTMSGSLCVTVASAGVTIERNISITISFLPMNYSTEGKCSVRVF